MCCAELVLVFGSDVGLLCRTDTLLCSADLFYITSHIRLLKYRVIVHLVKEMISVS